MIGVSLQGRIREYAAANAIEQENVLQETFQYYALAGLAEADFFSDAVFHGGTCLRILHGMNRFSEDLDFFLKTPNREFRWTNYLEKVRKQLSLEGLACDVQDRSGLEETVKKALLRFDLVGERPALDLPFPRDHRKKKRIKLEIDTRPPAGSGYETGFITFPRTAALTIQTLASGFGTKAHALLCRTYPKGRDWYDFVWYVSRRVVPDYQVLQNALFQQGPWAAQAVSVTPEWFVGAMRSRIFSVDWAAVRADVERFLPMSEQAALAHWNQAFFLYQLERAAGYLKGIR